MQLPLAINTRPMIAWGQLAIHKRNSIAYEEIMSSMLISWGSFDRYCKAR